MSPDRYTQRSCYALGAALALAASTALAQTSVPQQPVPEASAKPVLADSTATSLTALHASSELLKNPPAWFDSAVHLSFERGRPATRGGTRSRGIASLYPSHSNDLQLLLLGFR